jgi:predicted Zn-ribbon and HTH transcriptional regulator
MVASASSKEIGVVLLKGCRCRCGHEWLPRDPDEKPRVCPKCKSPNWDRPRQFERKNGKHR